MIVFGGFNGAQLNDVWVLSGADGVGSPSWTQLTPTGTPPSTRESSAAVYDPATNRMTLLAGFAESEAFRAQFERCLGIDERQWSWRDTGMDSAYSSGRAASSRFSNSVVYNAATNQAIAFGGLRQFTVIRLTTHLMTCGF